MAPRKAVNENNTVKPAVTSSQMTYLAEWASTTLQGLIRLKRCANGSVSNRNEMNGSCDCAARQRGQNCARGLTVLTVCVALVPKWRLFRI